MTRRAAAIAAALWLCVADAASAQDAGAPAGPPAPIVAPEPIAEGAAAAAEDAGDSPLGAMLGKNVSELSGPLKILLVMTALTFIPGMLLTLTCYTRIIIVLSFARRAIGAQELPPSPILIGLALFITGAIMSPTFGRIHESALKPLLAEKVSIAAAADSASLELKKFMLAQTREDDLVLALDLARAERPAQALGVPLTVAVPAFVLSELRTAFRMGFIIFLPFLLIDLVVACVLLALGMFMLPPTMIAMPLKILLFVLVDGWALLIQSLTSSFHAL